MTKRIEQINELLKQELSQLLLKEVDFPKDILVTVTRVIALDNLNKAKVYISVMPDKQSSRILHILERKVYFLQQKINKRLKMRPVPQIKFYQEKETASAGRIEELLEQLKRGR